MNDRKYTHEEYEHLLTRAIHEIQSLSTVKGGEYAGDEDRLANFRRNAKALGLPMETIWGVYAAKHWDSIMQYIQDLNTGKIRERSEKIEGRAMDLIVYLILFMAILEENNAGDNREPVPTKSAANDLIRAAGDAGLAGKKGSPDVGPPSLHPGTRGSRPDAT